jgi:hypothetical protein
MPEAGMSRSSVSNCLSIPVGVNLGGDGWSGEGWRRADHGSGQLRSRRRSQLRVARLNRPHVTTGRSCSDMARGVSASRSAEDASLIISSGEAVDGSEPEDDYRLKHESVAGP